MARIEVKNTIATVSRKLRAPLLAFLCACFVYELVCLNEFVNVGRHPWSLYGSLIAVRLIGMAVGVASFMGVRVLLEEQPSWLSWRGAASLCLILLFVGFLLGSHELVGLQELRKEGYRFNVAGAPILFMSMILGGSLGKVRRPRTGVATNSAKLD